MMASDNQYIKEILSQFAEEVFVDLKKIELMRMISDPERKKIIVVLDLVKYKPKYGEVLFSMQTAIILSRLGLCVKVVAIVSDSRNNEDYKRLVENDKVMKQVEEDIEHLMKLILLPKGIECKIIEDSNEIANKLEDTRQGYVLFKESIVNRRSNMAAKKIDRKKDNFFIFNQQLLQVLLMLNRKELLKETSPFLIGDIMKELSIKDKDIFRSDQSNVFATNFRYNLARAKKNSSTEQAIELAKILWKKFNAKTLFTTCKDGKYALENTDGFDAQFMMFYKPGNFIEESKAIVQSRMLYQIQGGGITSWHYCSNTLDYISLAWPGHIKPYKNKVLFPTGEYSRQLFMELNEENAKLFYGKLKTFIRGCML